MTDYDTAPFAPRATGCPNPDCRRKLDWYFVEVLGGDPTRRIPRADRWQAHCPCGYEMAIIRRPRKRPRNILDMV